jgi:hypothetical protein
MKELVEYIVRNLVDDPDQVQVTQTDSEKTSVLELRVAPQDIGKVIGRQGRIIKAIRTLINAAATKSSRRVVLEVLD